MSFFPVPINWMHKWDILRHSKFHNEIWAATIPKLFIPKMCFLPGTSRSKHRSRWEFSCGSEWTNGEQRIWMKYVQKWIHLIQCNLVQCSQGYVCQVRVSIVKVGNQPYSQSVGGWLASMGIFVLFLRISLMRFDQQ